MEFEHWKYDNHLIELLFDSNKSVREIAEDMRQSEAMVSQRIKLLGLDWVPKRNRGVSRGQTALTNIMTKLLPGCTIVNEHHIGEQLRLDVYCPSFNLACEYHGRQHYEHVPRFHETYDDFMRAKQRDERKAELCAAQDIALVVFRYCDELTEDAVFDRLHDAMRLSLDIPKVAIAKTKYSMKNNPYYVEMKQKRNAYQRELRQKIKQERKLREQDRASYYEEPYIVAEVNNY